MYQAHYCGEEIVEEHLGFTFNDISCGMSDKVEKDCGNNSESIEEDNCCKNVNSYNKLESKRDFITIGINIGKCVQSPIANYEVDIFTVFNIPVQLRSKPPPEVVINKNLSKQLSQAEYLAFIQSYLC